MVSGVKRVLKDSVCEREESPAAFWSSSVASRVALGMWGKSRQERRSMGTWVASSTCACPFPEFLGTRAFSASLDLEWH